MKIRESEVPFKRLGPYNKRNADDNGKGNKETKGGSSGGKHDEKDKTYGDYTKRRSCDQKSVALNKPNDRQRNRDYDRERERRQREILSYKKIREERELCEEERRRRKIRESQRHEEQRLADERRKLVIERERLEREKETERQKLEREKIELERLELKCQQMKIMQSPEERAVKRSTKRSSNDCYTEAPDRKRNTFDAPPAARFDPNVVGSRNASSTKRGIDDYSSSNKRLHFSTKRDDYVSSSTIRSAIKDYSSVINIGGGVSSDYLSSNTKCGIDDFGGPSSKSPNDYKRDVNVHHMSSSGAGGGGGGSNSSYGHKTSVGGVGGGGGCYSDNERSNANYRRGGGIDDMSNSNSNKRYDNSGGYSSNSNNAGNNIWSAYLSGAGGGGGGCGVGGGQIKSYAKNGLSSNIHGKNLQLMKPIGALCV